MVDPTTGTVLQVTERVRQPSSLFPGLPAGASSEPPPSRGRPDSPSPRGVTAVATGRGLGSRRRRLRGSRRSRRERRMRISTPVNAVQLATHRLWQFPTR